ncbi:hypothetical protein DOM22_04335 [Bdellovibrio sp. ZAP7]|uniref:hypothetical protein n=1 Tax=Bdellovibrio sp. ZAP7 TaxID=2231053 RepID=UPI00115840E9|nr:hypothetical protein [Bdellovibrio sp. ZAP7]QDK44438.1 hypothetical protein DOM22_04335 [Bdellovibrio sp. ZAP7]
MEKAMLSAICVFLISMASQAATSSSNQTPIEPALSCTNKVINDVYIPKLREVVDWPDDQIRPYAIQMCQLEKKRGELQVSIRDRAVQMRNANWRICKEVIPGNPNPTPAECKIAHGQIINDLIDHCIEVVNIGHNPHNVQLFLDPLMVEVACLKGVDTALK